MQNLFTVTKNIQGGVLRKKSSKTLNKILNNYIRKLPFFIQVAGSKKESIHKFKFK